MSKTKLPTVCLVIDASVAEAAGTSEPSPPSAARCRDFLAAALPVYDLYGLTEEEIGIVDSANHG